MGSTPVTVGSKALIPNPALKPFEVLVGSWRTEGSHGLLPGVKLKGLATFEWIEGGAFLLMRSEITDDSRFPSGLMIIGSDDIKKRFNALYFDERGVSRIFHVKVTSNEITWWRNHDGFSQRSVHIISRDGKTIFCKGELSRDGTTWEKDLELTYTRT